MIFHKISLRIQSTIKADATINYKPSLVANFPVNDYLMENKVNSLIAKTLPGLSIYRQLLPAFINSNLNIKAVYHWTLFSKKIFKKCALKKVMPNFVSAFP
ncbi:MAG TPA: hypothetical protein VIJ14_03445 [Rhabdochlamydiaceae bacterium]